MDSVLLPLCQGGVQLQRDMSLEDLWSAAMEGYRSNDWQTAVDQLEEAILVFEAYQNATLHCLQKCNQNGKLILSFSLWAWP